MVIGLGIDAGGSSSRWLLLDDTRGELGRGTVGSITGHIFTSGDERENLGRLNELLQAALAVARPEAVVGGITGFHDNTEVAEVFTAEVARTLGLDKANVQLDNDMSIAFAGAFAPGEGVLIYAGTGSVGYHVAADGSILRAGGYGYLIDDAGAGYWIGHEGIKQVFRWLDEQGGPVTSPLAHAIYEALGSDDWDDIIGTIYGGGRSRIAALAPAVALAAEDGDEAAFSILDRAGQELARLARVIFYRLDRVLPVAFAGGVAKLSPVLTASLKKALPPVALDTVTAEPVQAAARLALGLAQDVAARACGRGI